MIDGVARCPCTAGIRPLPLNINPSIQNNVQRENQSISKHTDHHAGWPRSVRRSYLSTGVDNSIVDK